MNGTRSAPRPPPLGEPPPAKTPFSPNTTALAEVGSEVHLGTRTQDPSGSMSLRRKGPDFLFGRMHYHYRCRMWLQQGKLQYVIVWVGEGSKGCKHFRSSLSKALLVQKIAHKETGVVRQAEMRWRKKINTRCSASCKLTHISCWKGRSISCNEMTQSK